MGEELYDLLKQKRKDDAIKYIRNKYDMDFKRAKETIDKMTKTLEYFEGKNRGLSKEDFHDMFKNSIISRIYDNDLYALIRENRKIEAVKYVKDKYNFDLEKAKAMVDTLEPEMFTEKSIISASNSNSSNFESGYGRYDIIAEPRNKNKRGFVIESKIVKDEKDLEKMSKEAIEQIKNKKYDTQLKERGIKDITLLGLAFCGKRMKVSYE